MLNPTVKAVTLVLLKSKPLSQIELVAITDKSNPSISRALKLLLHIDLLQEIIMRHTVHIRLLTKLRCLNF